MGFEALILILFYVSLAMDAAHIGRAVIVCLFAGLPLPIGVGIFVGRWSALFWAQIYLWLKFISGCIAIPVFGILRTKTPAVWP
jgi:hypothetical protein